MLLHAYVSEYNINIRSQACMYTVPLKQPFKHVKLTQNLENMRVREGTLHPMKIAEIDALNSHGTLCKFIL